MKAPTEYLLELNGNKRTLTLCFDTKEVLMLWCSALDKLELDTARKVGKKLVNIGYSTGGGLSTNGIDIANGNIPAIDNGLSSASSFEVIEFEDVDDGKARDPLDNDSVEEYDPFPEPTTKEKVRRPSEKL